MDKNKKVRLEAGISSRTTAKPNRQPNNISSSTNNQAHASGSTLRTSLPMAPVQFEAFMIGLEVEVTQHQVWDEVLKGAQTHYSNTNRPNASQIIDLTIALRELLQVNQAAIGEVVKNA